MSATHPIVRCRLCGGTSIPPPGEPPACPIDHTLHGAGPLPDWDVTHEFVVVASDEPAMPVGHRICFEWPANDDRGATQHREEIERAHRVILMEDLP